MFGDMSESEIEAFFETPSAHPDEAFSIQPEKSQGNEFDENKPNSETLNALQKMINTTSGDDGSS